MVDTSLLNRVQRVVNTPVEKLATLAKQLLIENGFNVAATGKELEEMPEMFVWYDKDTGKHSPVRVVKCSNLGVIQLAISGSNEQRFVPLQSLCVFELLELISYFVEE